MLKNRNLNHFFSKELMLWNERHNHRSMPWKAETDPYKVWLSEIILQQTKVEQGLSYYLNFVKSYPTVQDLANAPENDVLRLWQGLGYYSRARNLHYTAKDIVANYQGVFPSEYKNLLKLKGVGAYTAAAIASFVFKEAVAVLDGNVIRVLSRFFLLEDAFDTGVGKKVFQSKAQELLDLEQPDKYNQAIMDFGATICKPKRPLCDECPLKRECKALKEKKIGDLPFKSKRIKVKKRYFISFLVESRDGFILEKRGGQDIWKGLFQLPNKEVFSLEKKSIAQVENVYNELFSSEDFEILECSKPMKQKLTHQEIHMIFAKIKLGKELILKDKYIYSRNLTKFAFPKIFILYLRSKSLILE